jgi:hypothetical protein
MPHKPLSRVFPLSVALLASLQGCDGIPKPNAASASAVSNAASRLAVTSLDANAAPEPDGRTILEELGDVDKLPIKLEETQAVVNVIVRMTFDQSTSSPTNRRTRSDNTDDRESWCDISPGMGMGRRSSASSTGRFGYQRERSSPSTDSIKVSSLIQRARGS